MLLINYIYTIANALGKSYTFFLGASMLNIAKTGRTLEYPEGYKNTKSLYFASDKGLVRRF